MPDIILKNVTKKYGDVKALDNVSITIPDGELCVIVGPSGSGKTTLFNLIAGFIEADDGEISIGGKSVKGIPPRDRNIGMVFQDIGLFSHMTVRQNIGYGLRIQKKDKKEIDRRVSEIAQKLQISSLLNKKPNQISGGEAQRVAIGRTLIMNPSICLFDEPLGNLDANLRIDMLEEIKTLHSALGRTFIFITHDQEQALSAGTLAIVMKDGKILQCANPQEIYHNPESMFVGEFFGISSMNMVEGVISKSGSNTVFAGKGIQHILTGAAEHIGKNVILGVRPLDIYIKPHAEADGIGTVELIENLGDRRLIYISFDNTKPVVASVFSSERYQIGDKVGIGFKKVYIFDAGQGRRLL